MRYFTLLTTLILIAGCAPVRENSPARAEEAPDYIEAVPPLTAPALAQANAPALVNDPAPTISSPASRAKASRHKVSGIVFEGVAFDSRGNRLVVLDQASGPGSRFLEAEASGRSIGGLAAVNAGFFTPEGNPLGLAIAAGEIRGKWNSASSLGSGVWHADSKGNAAISRREALGKNRALGMRDLIQAGPMLIDHGAAVDGLDAGKFSVRTMILWDGGTRWWVGRCSPCSLSQLAATLASSPPAIWPVLHALNLDGGRSTDLWISGEIDGGPLSFRPPWNRPVRNFLILIK